MIIDLTKPEDIPLGHVGGKAFNLHKLVRFGMPVPSAIVVRADMAAHELDSKDFINQLTTHPVILSGERFAVRSSGVGEDGALHSFAGIFDSFLDVPKNEVHDAILRVRDSITSARSSMYATQKSAAITSMGVVIQHMIDAEYAGVAFSASPVENDERIALLEVVRGNGDSLVSGRKTPATLRVNKLTGSFRIQQLGEDGISEETLGVICDTIMPLVEEIGEAYATKVDVEWAMANGVPYILQARPITT